MYSVDGFDNFGAILKRLDELDARHYTHKKYGSSENLKRMAASSDLGQDDNESDFDNSDDLASLLDDDDDDVFAKKVFGNPPAKTSAAEAKKSSDSKKASPANEFLQSPSEEIISKSSKDKPIYDDFGDNVLDEFLESNINKTVSSDIKLTSPHKTKSKKNSFPNEDDDFLDDLSLSQFSPSKDTKTKSTPKNSDILDDFNTKNTSSKAAENRRGSYFDDFLQKLSPKHRNNVPITPDISDENLKNDNESDEDILGTYIPSSTKKNDIASHGVAKSPKKRGSLSKQVSFKGVSDDFPEIDVPKSETFSSPEKSKNAKDIIPVSGKSENSTYTKRNEKSNLNKDEDMDWLSYFSPKKTSKSHETKKKSNDSLEKIGISAESKSKPAMKRQSSADWLGLSDSKIVDDNDNESTGLQSIKGDSIDKTSLNPVKHKSVSAPVIRPRRQESNKIADELQDNDFLKNINQPSAIDLSEILNDTEMKLPDKKNKSSPFLKDSFENIDSVPSNTRKPKVNSNAQIISNSALSDNFTPDIITHKNYVLNDSLNKSSKNLPENFDALQSMQMMLDDSVKERNKLIKELEATKIVYEEKIKASEELHKSEKKMLEDSFKIMEASLKQEFEVKFKSLEERLTFVTEDKEKQAKSFEEKLQNLIKEHQVEIQRLKELHNQSVNILKQDHEDALSRLKKLKEQEIEAILSTQVHTKSLQYLSDQLEARANELASLENKVEERNQSTLREKQLFLDAKEKELRVLQNRLQKQLDDSEEDKTRLQQLVLRLENRLQKQTMEGEEDHWEAQQLKAKLTVQQKYLEEEQKLHHYQIEKEKEKLKMAQDSLLHEQKTVLLQLAQERQQLTQEKIDLQALTKIIREQEAKLNVMKLKEESSRQAEMQFLTEEKNKLHFEKERVKQEFYQLERERDSLVKEKQQLRRDRETLHEQEMDLKRKSAEIEEVATVSTQAQDKARREHAEALAIKKEQQHRMQQYNQQMQTLMEKERVILSEREKLVAEKIEFEKYKNSVLCTKCKLSLETPLQVSTTPSFNMPVVFPLPGNNGLSNQVHQSFMDPNLVIWHVTAQKDREFLQEELAFLKSLKEANKKKNSS